MKHCDLTSADMESANLRNANLTGAILDCTNLYGADLRWAVYDKSAVVSGGMKVHSRWCSLVSQSAALSCALTDTALHCCGATLAMLPVRWCWPQCCPDGVLQGALLGAIDWRAQNLQGAELHHADLQVT